MSWHSDANSFSELLPYRSTQHWSLKYWILRTITSARLDLICNHEREDQNVILHRLHPDKHNEQTLKFPVSLNETCLNESLHFSEKFAAEDGMLSQISLTVSPYTGALPLEIL